MNPSRIIFITLFFLLAITAINSNASVTELADCPPFYDSLPGVCNFNVGSDNFEISTTGNGVRLSAGKKKTEFSIPLKPHEYIEKIHYYNYKNDLVLICGMSDGDSGWGGIFRLDNNSMKVLWELNVPSFNISSGLVQEKNLYQTAMGFVSMVDLDKGKYVWSYSGLYDSAKYSFNSFEVPKILDNDIIFTEVLQTKKHYAKPRTIRVGINTGKITIENR